MVARVKSARTHPVLRSIAMMCPVGIQDFLCQKPNSRQRLLHVAMVNIDDVTDQFAERRRVPILDATRHLAWGRLDCFFQGGRQEQEFQTPLAAASANDWPPPQQ